MKHRKRKIEELEAAAADYNPRHMNDREREALVRSIKTYGALVPPVLNTRTGRLVGGHQRVRAAKELGITELETVEIDIDETQEKLLNIALNKIGGKFVPEEVLSMIDDITAAGEDPTESGFDRLDLYDLRKIIGVDDEPGGNMMQLKVTVRQKDRATIAAAIKKAKAAGPFDETQNKNGNGNAIHRIARAYLDRP
jgi:hypothetical protein